MKDYLTKYLGKGSAAPAIPSISHILWSWIGALLAIAAIAWLSDQAGALFFMVPFGASCVLVFGVPNSPLAQPRSLVLGHLIAALVGLVVLELLGANWFAMGIAVATAIALMQLTRTLHAPAGATPLVVMLEGADWAFLVTPVLSGALVILIVGLITNNLSRNRSYPEYW
ncbi:HPP family protein [Kiloniella sp. EL199]|uniref:HPP family protein n=1 Tax=Kiloniella sp. EL199 TaxID=2107581 RepID=UPI000EA194A8|nr:HPP family protein [Kiloniella sp. EL199]